MVKHPCIVCGKPLKIKAKKYCSIQCTGEDRKGKKRPKFFTKAGLQRLADKARIRMKGNKINLGRKGSLAGNKKKSERMQGSNHWNWRGGITELNHRIRNCFKYRQWRSDIFQRDNFTCVLCNKRGGWLEVDHFPKMFSAIIREYRIESFEQAIECEELWSINNGRTLCEKCHHETDTYGNKKSLSI